jgi:hypothetical protein
MSSTDARCELELLRALGVEWAAQQAPGDARDTPSRTTAFRLASLALGRSASPTETAVLQRAAQAARAQNARRENG